MDEYDKKGNVSFLGSMGNLRYFVFALIAIIVILGLFWVIGNREGDTEPLQEDQEASEEREEADVEEEVSEDEETIHEEEESEHEDVIEVLDQERGDSVFVSSMNLTDNRWIVIHEDREGELGNILGARLFTEDATEGEVGLLRNTEEGKDYHAVLYMVAEREEEVGRQFDTKRDVPLIKDGGEVKKVIFSVY